VFAVFAVSVYYAGEANQVLSVTLRNTQYVFSYGGVVNRHRKHRKHRKLRLGRICANPARNSGPVVVWLS